jgi:hypothetical protein
MSGLNSIGYVKSSINIQDRPDWLALTTEDGSLSSEV